MMALITPNEMALTARITEAEIRDRIAREVMEQCGACDDTGKPHPGVKIKVTRGDGRTGGYAVVVTGPAPTRLTLAAISDL